MIRGQNRHWKVLQSRSSEGTEKYYQKRRPATGCKHRGSYMSAHVLLNLLNELWKRDKMRGLSSILSRFRNEFNKFNNIGALMLDSIYHMTLQLF